MGKSCKEVAQSLVECMKASSCVQGGGDIQACMKTAEECQVGLSADPTYLTLTHLRADVEP